MSIKSDKNTRIRENLYTEGFAVWFAHHHLSLEILKIEADGDIVSPYRKKEKSCDIHCRAESGSEYFFEVKDMSGDLIKGQKSGMRGYLPQTQVEVRKWLSNQVFDAIQKGAAHLIVRIPVYRPEGGSNSASDIHFEIFRNYQYTSQSDIDVVMSLDVPSHFQGVWFIKNGAYSFYTIRKLEERQKGALA